MNRLCYDYKNNALIVFVNKDSDSEVWSIPVEDPSAAQVGYEYPGNRVSGVAHHDGNLYLFDRDENALFVLENGQEPLKPRKPALARIAKRIIMLTR